MFPACSWSAVKDLWQKTLEVSAVNDYASSSCVQPYTTFVSTSVYMTTSMEVGLLLTSCGSLR